MHFVDLDDGRRVTSEAFGEMSLHMSGGSTLDELRDELREFSFQDDLGENDESLAAEPRWPEMASALHAHGIVADDERLLALPFLVKLDDDVVAAFDDQ